MKGRVSESYSIIGLSFHYGRAVNFCTMDHNLGKIHKNNRIAPKVGGEVKRGLFK